MLFYRTFRLSVGNGRIFGIDLAVASRKSKSQMLEILCSAVVSLRELTETRNTTKVLANHLFLKLIRDVSIRIVLSSQSPHSLTYIYIYVYSITHPKCSALQSWVGA